MWESIKRGIQDGAAVAVARAEALTQVGRARLDIAAAKTRISRLERQLGSTVYRRLDAGQGAAVADDGEVRDLCGQIGQAHQALEASRVEYERLRRDLEIAPDEEREAPLGT